MEEKIMYSIQEATDKLGDIGFTIVPKLHYDDSNVSWGFYIGACTDWTKENGKLKGKFYRSQMSYLYGHKEMGPVFDPNLEMLPKVMRIHLNNLLSFIIEKESEWKK